VFLKRGQFGLVYYGNSLKLYDKAFTVVGSVLRAEATVHNGGDFRVYRPKEGDPEGELAWTCESRGQRAQFKSS